VSQLFGRAIAALGLTLVALLLATFALGFLAAALYLTFAMATTPATAALLCGAVFLVTAAIVALIARVVVHRRGTPKSPSASLSADVAGQLGQFLGESTGASLKKHAPNIVLAAFAAGLAVGISPRLRRTLWKLLD
jgi:membrane protein implicated in regulation of membrane protease activity